MDNSIALTTNHTVPKKGRKTPMQPYNGQDGAYVAPSAIDAERDRAFELMGLKKKGK